MSFTTHLAKNPRNSNSNSNNERWTNRKRLTRATKTAPTARQAGPRGVAESASRHTIVASHAKNSTGSTVTRKCASLQRRGDLKLRRIMPLDLPQRRLPKRMNQASAPSAWIPYRGARCVRFHANMTFTVNAWRRFGSMACFRHAPSAVQPFLLGLKSFAKMRADCILLLVGKLIAGRLLGTH